MPDGRVNIPTARALLGSPFSPWGITQVPVTGRCRCLNYRTRSLVRKSAGVVLVCTSCEHTWEPTLDDFETGHTGYPRCGGWTMIAELAEPRYSIVRLQA